MTLPLTVSPPGPPLSGFLLPVRERMASLACLEPALLEQALLIRYDPSAGIGWHGDRPNKWRCCQSNANRSLQDAEAPAPLRGQLASSRQSARAAARRSL